MNLFDSHCHLNFSDFDTDRSQVIENCTNVGISGICIPATQSADWNDLIRPQAPAELRQYVALGLHPCFLREHKEHDIDLLDELLSQNHSHVVAVGETGLDFYECAQSEQQRVQQQALFFQHVILSKKHQLPLIIHARKSHDQVLKILRQIKPEAGGIIHAYSGSEQQAKQYIDLGFKLGFGGGITYPRARKTRQLASSLPMDSIVLETDAPDMPLNGFQGLRNTPEQLPLVAKCLAQLRKISSIEVAETTTSACLQLFGNH